MATRSARAARSDVERLNAGRTGTVASRSRRVLARGTSLAFGDWYWRSDARERVREERRFGGEGDARRGGARSGRLWREGGGGGLGDLAMKEVERRRRTGRRAVRLLFDDVDGTPGTEFEVTKAARGR